MNGKSYLVLVCLFLALFGAGSAGAQSIFNKKSGGSAVPERGIVFVVGGGTAAAKSDICSGLGCNNLGLNVSGGALYRFSQRLSVGGSIDYARLGATGTDSLRLQQVSFQSEVIEVAGMVVFDLLDINAGTGNYRSSRKRLLVPYIKAGAGFVYYTPTSYSGAGELRNSQITHEPERKYPAVALAVPFGAGLRIRLSEVVSIAPEFTYHITTTDHLDNMGARAGSHGNDHYGTAAFKVLYTPVLRNRILSRK